jgi:hypothetical protein
MGRDIGGLLGKVAVSWVLRRHIAVVEVAEPTRHG